MTTLALGKLGISFLLVLLLSPLAASYVSSQYSFMKNLTVSPTSVNGNTITVSITFDIYFGKQAWNTFKYADGSFGPMNAWWQSQVGNTFSYAGFSAKLLSVQWTLLHHYSDHDRLNAIAKIQYLS